MSYLIAFAAGLLTAAPFLIQGMWPAAWLSIAPLFWLAAAKKSAYRHGLAFFAAFYGALYYWFTCLYPMDFAGFNKLQSIGLILICWLGMTMLQGAVSAFVPFLYRHLRTGKAYIDPFLAASLWVIFEWLQTQTWAGVPWGRMAVSQHKYLPAIQSASLLGSLFISFLIALSNGFIAAALERIWPGSKILAAFVKNSAGKANPEKPDSAESFSGRSGRFARAACIAIAAAIFASNILYGINKLILYNDNDEPAVTAAVIQGNIASGDKWADNSVANSIAIYTALTAGAVEEYSPQIILWPETVITAGLRNNKQISESISQLAKNTGAVILVGAFDYIDKNDGGEKERYNAIVAFYSDGAVGEEPYYKRHLVPFGEYLPSPRFFNTFIPVLAKMNLFKDDLTPGTKTNLIKTEYGYLGGLVCFDSIYGELVRESVNDGANLIVLSTNDSWYRDSAAVYQHNGHAVLRAVENGRYAVRAANTGISTVISPTGRILTMLEPLTSGFASAEVKMLSSQTLYSRIGDTWLILCAALVGAAAIYKAVYFGIICRTQKCEIRK